MLNLLITGTLKMKYLSQGEGGGGYSDIFIHTLAHFLGFKILNWVFRKINSFLGIKILWIFLGGPHKMGYI